MCHCEICEVCYSDPAWSQSLLVYIFVQPQRFSFLIIQCQNNTDQQFFVVKEAFQRDLSIFDLCANGSYEGKRLWRMLIDFYWCVFAQDSFLLRMHLCQKRSVNRGFSHSSRAKGISAPRSICFWSLLTGWKIKTVAVPSLSLTTATPSLLVQGYDLAWHTNRLNSLKSLGTWQDASLDHLLQLCEHICVFSIGRAAASVGQQP